MVPDSPSLLSPFLSHFVFLSLYSYASSLFHATANELIGGVALFTE